MYIHRLNPDAYDEEISDITLDDGVTLNDQFACATEEAIKHHSQTIQTKPDRTSVIAGYIKGQHLGWGPDEIPTKAPREHQYTDGAFNSTIEERIL